MGLRDLIQCVMTDPAQLTKVLLVDQIADFGRVFVELLKKYAFNVSVDAQSIDKKADISKNSVQCTDIIAPAEAWAMGQGHGRGLWARAVGRGFRAPLNDALSGQNPCKNTIRHKKIMKWDST